MCFVWISEQTAIISLYSINWLVCVTETESVYCAVRTECLNTIQVIKIPRPLLRTITVSILTSSCTYILIFIVLLLEGRAGESWEPSNKEKLCLSLSLFSLFSFHISLLPCSEFYSPILQLHLSYSVLGNNRSYSLYPVSITPPLLDTHARPSLHKQPSYQSDFIKINHTLFSINEQILALTKKAFVSVR